MNSNIFLSRIAEASVIFLAVIAVAVADVLLKKATALGTLRDVIHSPWLIFAVGLYLLQICLFIGVFLAGWKLSIIGALQTAIYALIVLAAGVLFYDESLTRMQAVGFLLALGGVVLMN